MACLVLAAGHALSVWLIGRDAWPGAGAGAPDSLLELARLLLVALALWYCALEDRHARASADARPAARGGGHQAQDELRLAELAGALDTQRQMNALLSHELRAPLATISAAAQSLDMILAGNGEAVDNRLARIHRSVTRMTELLEQLLTQDRREEQALTRAAKPSTWRRWRATSWPPCAPIPRMPWCWTRTAPCPPIATVR